MRREFLGGREVTGPWADDEWMCRGCPATTRTLAGSHARGLSDAAELARVGVGRDAGEMRVRDMPYGEWTTGWRFGISGYTQHTRDVDMQSASLRRGGKSSTHLRRTANSVCQCRCQCQCATFVVCAGGNRRYSAVPRLPQDNLVNLSVAMLGEWPSVIK